MLGGKFRDKVRVYGDTDVYGKHTGTDMGKAIQSRIDMGFTIVKMDLGIELLYDEPGCLNAPLGMLENMQKYSAKAIAHQGGSIDKELMRGKNHEIFTVPHYATGIHITEKGMDYLEDYVKQVRDVVGYGVPLATGEDIYLAENFEPLLKNHGISIAHPDLLSIGGALETKKLGDMCENTVWVWQFIWQKVQLRVWRRYILRITSECSCS